MAWFKVDDGFWAHPKTLAISNASIALWLKAGTWSCQQLTDGFIPEYVLRTLGGTRREVNELISVGYWLAGDGGWVFHDWEDYQELSTKVKERRRKNAEKLRKWRESRQQENQDSNPECNQVTDQVTNHDGNPAPDPTRPDPTVNTVNSSLNNESNQNLSNTYSSEKNSDGNKETSAQKLVRLKNEHPTALALCEKLVERIHTEHGRKPKIGIKWIQEAEKLMRIDGYTPHQIEYMINWALTDTFWRAHILSMPKLREKFTTLVAQAKTRHEEQQQAQVSTTDKRTAEGLALIAKLEAEHEAEQTQQVIEETNLFLIGGTNE